ncbi:hypothetical protein AAII07_07675 [Microvirga sp. 0TCS3.31]
MAASDAIVIGEDWISEHYFTTDAKTQSFAARVLERRKSWEEHKDAGTARTRFTAARADLLSTFAALDDADAGEIGALNDRLRTVLGYDAVGLRVDRSGPVTWIGSAGLADTADLAVIDARPAAAIEQLLDKDADNLLEPYVVDEKQQVTSVSRLISTLFVSETPPAFVLVLAGRRALVAERERWPEGRYLQVDLQLICERSDDRRGGEVDRALTCLSAESLAPDAEGMIWWQATLEESVKHTVGVSKDLREGVRLSIEIIANEVVTRRAEAGLPPLAADQAQPLAKQSLRFLYRILFLLYAEASPELGVLPTGAPEYERGYSLDRLRDLTLVELAEPQSRTGTHLYDSLSVLFGLVEGKRRGRQVEPDTEGNYVEGLEFRSLRADLFAEQATAHIDAVGLGNERLQEVLRHLLLSKEARGKDRGFISYAELGINQLGAVYEGLMSYTGFFAETDLYEVAKGGDSSKGSWVVPVERAAGIAGSDFVKASDPITGEEKPILHRRGTFVFRLAGRERQQSASYYTPEVLTRFVVSQALEELLDQDDRRTTAAEILELTVCEPALGSGAFAIEAVRQLADEYLKRRQVELGESVDPDEYPRELQKVKAYLALHQVYGVDLNATAVELAEISLWLDTMVEGLAAPWFGLHLRRGNSLIGARRAAFRRDQVADKTWLKAVPTPVDAGDSLSGRVPHFLLPADGWGAAADVGKDIKDLVPDAVRDLKDWRKSMWAKPQKKQVDALVAMSDRVQRLWEIAQRRLEIADAQIRRDIPLWGRDMGGPTEADVDRHVTREEIEESLADDDGAYQRLRRIMDAWSALWFWPLTEGEITPPTAEQWYDALEKILGRSGSAKAARQGDDTLADAATWDELGIAEELDRDFAGASRMEDVLSLHPWLRVCERIADQQGFFHWELDFASVFAERGGFDLQVGNPPWVRPTSDVEALLAEGDPWWQLKGKASQASQAIRRRETVSRPGMLELVVMGSAEVGSIAAFVGSEQLYSSLKGMQPDLYRCFMQLAWSHQSRRGIAALLHPESHFTEERAGRFRAEVYGRLRRHWQFVNALMLFEIKDNKRYGIHVYGDSRSAVAFLHASSLYHPDTVDRSIRHDRVGPEPGLRDEQGNWDLRPHRNRIIEVDEATLNAWRDILEDGDLPIRHTRMVYVVSSVASEVLERIGKRSRLARKGLLFSPGWHEKNDRTKGFFDSDWGRVDSWRNAVLQGPHFFISTPFYKVPNSTMLHNQDWSQVDLEALESDALPLTAYKPLGPRSRYDDAYTHWSVDGEVVSARDHYRVAWRRMADTAGQRTLISALVPPGAALIQTVGSVALPGQPRNLVLAAGSMSTMISDFMIRIAPKADILFSSVERLPAVDDSEPIASEIVLRTLRLNCLTEAYSRLWRDCYDPVFLDCAWATDRAFPGVESLGEISPEWTRQAPLRTAVGRRQAQLEVDVLVAKFLNVSADELCALYRSQFPAMYKFDRTVNFFDANGRLVPNSVLTVWRKKSDRITDQERTATNPSGNTYVYELPYQTLDREADMRQAYAHFERILAERS